MCQMSTTFLCKHRGYVKISCEQVTQRSCIALLFDRRPKRCLKTVERTSIELCRTCRTINEREWERQRERQRIAERRSRVAGRRAAAPWEPKRPSAVQIRELEPVRGAQSRRAARGNAIELRPMGGPRPSDREACRRDPISDYHTQAQLSMSPGVDVSHDSYRQHPTCFGARPQWTGDVQSPSTSKPGAVAMESSRPQLHRATERLQAPDAEGATYYGSADGDDEVSEVSSGSARSDLVSDILSDDEIF